MPSIKHKFVSAKGQGTDATQVQASNWNAEHDFTCASGVVLGRASPGTGPVEELPNSFYSTGDVKLSMKVAPDDGWIFFGGSIGNAGSGATIRANADTLNLYVLIYNNTTQDICFVAGGRSGNPVTDFNNSRAMGLPKALGRSLWAAGQNDVGVFRQLALPFGANNYATGSPDTYAAQSSISFTIMVKL